MGKGVRLSFQREPSFFLAERIANVWSELVVLEDDETQELLGFGVRSGRQYVVNGTPQELGYISQLRLIPEYRNGLYLAKGYKKFRELHEGDPRIPYYITTILSDNQVARSLLESGRSGLPTYRPLDELSSCFFVARHIRQSPLHEQIPITNGALLARYRSYARTCALATWHGGDTSWIDALDHETIFLSSSRFSASGILVDYSQMKQIIIDGYDHTHRALAFCARIAAPIMRFIPPPRVGNELSCLYLVAPSFEGDTEEGFTALLRYAMNRAYERDKHGIVYGLSANDPNLSTALRSSLSTTKSMLYAVAWDESKLPSIQGATLIDVSTL